MGFGASSGHSGSMIALVVPDPETYALNSGSPEDTPADELHITLAYLGEAADISPEQRAAILDACQTLADTSQAPEALFPATSGVFPPDPESSDEVPKAPYYAAPANPERFNELREDLVTHLGARGVGDLVSTKHPVFNPHVTLTYAPLDSPPDLSHLPMPLPTMFHTMVVTFGDESYEYELGQPQVGPELPLTASARHAIAELAYRTHNSEEYITALYLRQRQVKGTPSQTRAQAAINLVAAAVDSAHVSDRYTRVRELANRAKIESSPEGRAFVATRALALASRTEAPQTPMEARELASLTASLRSLVADGNSSVARSLRARKQLRDRYGRWIEEGGGVRFKIRKPGTPGGGTWYHGIVKGFDIPNKRVYVELPDGKTVQIPNDKLEQPKAILGLKGISDNLKKFVPKSRDRVTPATSPKHVARLDRKATQDSLDADAIAAMDRLKNQLQPVASGPVTGGHITRLLEGNDARAAVKNAQDSGQSSAHILGNIAPFKDVDAEVDTVDAQKVIDNLDNRIKNALPADYDQMSDADKAKAYSKARGGAIAGLGGLHNDSGSKDAVELRKAPSVGTEKDLEGAQVDPADIPKSEDLPDKDMIDGLNDSMKELENAVPDDSKWASTRDRILKATQEASSRYQHGADDKETFLNNLDSIKEYANEQEPTATSPKFQPDPVQQAFSNFAEDLDNVHTSAGGTDKVHDSKNAIDSAEKFLEGALADPNVENRSQIEDALATVQSVQTKDKNGDFLNKPDALNQSLSDVYDAVDGIPGDSTEKSAVLNEISKAVDTNLGPEAPDPDAPTPTPTPTPTPVAKTPDMSREKASDEELPSLTKNELVDELAKEFESEGDSPAKAAEKAMHFMEKKSKARALKILQEYRDKKANPQPEKKINFLPQETPKTPDVSGPADQSGDLPSTPQDDFNLPSEPDTKETAAWDKFEDVSGLMADISTDPNTGDHTPFNDAGLQNSFYDLQDALNNWYAESRQENPDHKHLQDYVDEVATAANDFFDAAQKSGVTSNEIDKLDKATQDFQKAANDFSSQGSSENTAPEPNAEFTDFTDAATQLEHFADDSFEAGSNEHDVIGAAANSIANAGKELQQGKIDSKEANDVVGAAYKDLNNILTDPKIDPDLADELDGIMFDVASIQDRLNKGQYDHTDAQEATPPEDNYDSLTPDQRTAYDSAANAFNNWAGEQTDMLHAEPDFEDGKGSGFQPPVKEQNDFQDFAANVMGLQTDFENGDLTKEDFLNKLDEAARVWQSSDGFKALADWDEDGHFQEIFSGDSQLTNLEDSLDQNVDPAAVDKKIKAADAENKSAIPPTSPANSAWDNSDVADILKSDKDIHFDQQNVPADAEEPLAEWEKELLGYNEKTPDEAVHDIVHAGNVLHSKLESIENDPNASEEDQTKAAGTADQVEAAITKIEDAAQNDGITDSENASPLLSYNQTQDVIDQLKQQGSPVAKILATHFEDKLNNNEDITQDDLDAIKGLIDFVADAPSQDPHDTADWTTAADALDSSALPAPETPAAPATPEPAAPAASEAPAEPAGDMSQALADWGKDLSDHLATHGISMKATPEEGSTWNQLSDQQEANLRKIATTLPSELQTPLEDAIDEHTAKRITDDELVQVISETLMDMPFGSKARNQLRGAQAGVQTNKGALVPVLHPKNEAYKPSSSGELTLPSPAEVKGTIQAVLDQAAAGADMKGASTEEAKNIENAQEALENALGHFNSGDVQDMVDELRQALDFYDEAIKLRGDVHKNDKVIRRLRARRRAVDEQLAPFEGRWPDPVNGGNWQKYSGAYDYSSTAPHKDRDGNEVYPGDRIQRTHKTAAGQTGMVLGWRGNDTIGRQAHLWLDQEKKDRPQGVAQDQFILDAVGPNNPLWDDESYTGPRVDEDVYKEFKDAQEKKQAFAERKAARAAKAAPPTPTPTPAPEAPSTPLGTDPEKLAQVSDVPVGGTVDISVGPVDNPNVTITLTKTDADTWQGSNGVTFTDSMVSRTNFKVNGPADTSTTPGAPFDPATAEGADLAGHPDITDELKSLPTGSQVQTVGTIAGEDTTTWTKADDGYWHNSHGDAQSGQGFDNEESVVVSHVPDSSDSTTQRYDVNNPDVMEQITSDIEHATRLSEIQQISDDMYASDAFDQAEIDELDNQIENKRSEILQSGGTPSPTATPQTAPEEDADTTPTVEAPATGTDLLGDPQLTEKLDALPDGSVITGDLTQNGKTFTITKQEDSSWPQGVWIDQDGNPYFSGNIANTRFDNLEVLSRPDDATPEPAAPATPFEDLQSQINNASGSEMQGILSDISSAFARGDIDQNEFLLLTSAWRDKNNKGPDDGGDSGTPNPPTAPSAPPAAPATPTPAPDVNFDSLLSSVLDNHEHIDWSNDKSGNPAVNKKTGDPLTEGEIRTKARYEASKAQRNSGWNAGEYFAVVNGTTIKAKTISEDREGFELDPSETDLFATLAKQIQDSNIPQSTKDRLNDLLDPASLSDKRMFVDARGDALVAVGQDGQIYGPFTKDGRNPKGNHGGALEELTRKAVRSGGGRWATTVDDTDADSLARAGLRATHSLPDGTIVYSYNPESVGGKYDPTKVVSAADLDEARTAQEEARKAYESSPFYISLDQGEMGDAHVRTDVPKLDKKGNPVLDKNGNPVMESKKGPWGVHGASGLVVRHVDPATGEERFLMVQRSKHIGNSYKWQFGGGAINSKEDSEQGAAREFYEETLPPEGWLSSLTHVGTNTTTDPTFNWDYANVAADTPTMFDPTLDYESADAQWLTRQQIADLEANGDLLPSVAASIRDSLALFGGNAASALPKGTVRPKKAKAAGFDTPSTNLSLSDITDKKTFVKAAGGSNGAGYYDVEMTDGSTQQFVIKKLNKDSGRQEALASALYRAMGIDAPEVVYNEKEGALYSKVVEGLSTQSFSPSQLAAMRDGFAADAWLAAWDIRQGDNTLLTRDGKPIRIDNGGTLEYRAQGSKKGTGGTTGFGPTVGELDTFRDGRTQASGIYGQRGSTPDSWESDSAQRVVDLPDEAIRGLVSDFNLPDTLADTLIARRDDIASRYSLTPTKKDLAAQFSDATEDSYHPEGSVAGISSTSPASPSAVSAGKSLPLTHEKASDTTKWDDTKDRSNLIPAASVGEAHTLSMSDGSTQDFAVYSPKTPEQGQRLQLITSLYNELGIATPQIDYDAADDKVYAALLEQGTNLGAAGHPAVSAGFVADAWLGNFRISDKTISYAPDGTPIRTDLRAALGGGRAPFDSTNMPDALDGLRNSSVNTAAASIFGDRGAGFDDFEFDGAESIISIPDDRIRELVAQSGLDDSMADTLIARRDAVQKYYGLETPQLTRTSAAAKSKIDSAETFRDARRPLSDSQKAEYVGASLPTGTNYIGFLKQHRGLDQAFEAMWKQENPGKPDFTPGTAQTEVLGKPLNPVNNSGKSIATHSVANITIKEVTDLLTEFDVSSKDWTDAAREFKGNSHHAGDDGQVALQLIQMQRGYQETNPKVSLSEYKKLLSGTFTHVFRGADASSLKSIRDGNWRGGTGMRAHGSGVYTSTSAGQAQMYGSGQSIMEMAFDAGSAKIADSGDLYSLASKLQRQLSTINLTAEERKFLQAILGHPGSYRGADIGALAAFLGFDAIQGNNHYGSAYDYNILNKSLVVFNDQSKPMSTSSTFNKRLSPEKTSNAGYGNGVRNPDMMTLIWLDDTGHNVSKQVKVTTASAGGPPDAV